MEWIKCSEKMPAKNEMVFFYNGQVARGRYCGDGFVHSFYIGTVRNVTHWMPCDGYPDKPQPPEE
ncbi:TPA: DUF551 domain-containing protein [Morganella morganii]|nr:DUF551 domain-containing protein [Morganella morganii]